MVLERLDRLLGHRVHRLGADQLLDVEDVAVVGVLGRGRGPEAALLRRAVGAELLPALAGVELLVALVRELRVRHGELALEVSRRAGLVEPAVGLGVDARDEEAGDRRDLGRVAATLHQPLEPAQVRLHDLDVALQREDQRDVDVPPARDHLLDRGQAGFRRRDLDEAVRPVDDVVQALRLVDRALRVEGEVRVDLDRDVAVLPLAAVPDGAQQVARVLDVLDRELEEGLFRVVLARENLAQLLVVRVALDERLLEDRRVRGHADDRVLAHQLLQLALMDQAAGEVVDPDALAQLGQLLQA